MRILITGGAGFVGSNLSNALNKEGHEVLVVDSLKNGSFQDLDKGIQTLHKDLTMFQLDTLEFKADIVFHLVCTALIESMKYPKVDLDVNGKTILNALNYAKKVGAKLIYTSSGSVHGEVGREGLPIHEDSQTEPANFYGATKLLAEHYCKVYNKEHKVPVLIFRLWNVFGYPQRINHAIGWVPVVTAFLVEEDPVIFGTGEQTRDFTYVKDVVKGLMLGVKHINENPNCEIINLCGGAETSLNELYKKCSKLLGRTQEPKYSDPSPGDVAYVLADNSKARKLLNWHPTKFDEGLEDYYKKIQTLDKSELIS